MNNEEIAAVCYSVIKEYSLSLEDPSRYPPSFTYHYLDKNIRDGYEKAIQEIKDGTRKSPEELHKKWCEDRFKDGWTFGEYKNVEKKTHPCLVDYKDLSKREKVKDTIFLEITKALISEQ